jgi:uncharacterized membrane protein (UPF0127 family)
MEQGYIYIHRNVLPTLLAISEDEQQRGLMHEQWPPPVMSFIYTEPRINKFWMHNTPSPLDIVFCHDGKVSQLHIGEPFSTQMIGDNKFSDLIVELPRGSVEKLGIQIGQEVGVLKPNAEELHKIMAEKRYLLPKFYKPLPFNF